MPKAKPSYIYNQQMIKIMIGVYKITSLKNKIYVGQTVDLERRKNTYKALNVGVKGQPKLYNSLLKKVMRILQSNGNSSEEQKNYLIYIFFK